MDKKRSKFAPGRRNGDAPSQHPIICPYCLRSLLAKDIVFISDDPDERPEQDEVHVAFMKTVERDYNGGRSFKKKVIGRGTGDGRNYPREFPQQIGDVEIDNRNRACGYCHNDIPAGAGEYEMIMIGLSGASDAGKTVYLLSLMQEMPRLFASEGAGGSRKMICEPVGVHQLTMRRGRRASIRDEMYIGVAPQDMEKDPDLQAILEDSMDDPLGTYFVLPANTVRTYQPPAIFKLTIGSRTYLMVFYDIAGEALLNSLDVAMTGRFMSAADGIIYLVDPRRVTDDRLAETVVSGITNRDAGKPCYTAFTVSKADEWLEDAKSSGAISVADALEKVVFDRHNQRHALFDWRAANWMDALARIGYDAELRHRRATLEQFFRAGAPKDDSRRYVRYFAMSALGEDCNVKTVLLNQAHAPSAYGAHLPKRLVREPVEPPVQEPFASSGRYGSGGEPFASAGSGMAANDGLVAHIENQRFAPRTGAFGQAAEYAPFGRQAEPVQAPAPEHYPPASDYDDNDEANQIRYMAQMPVGAQTAAPVAWIFYMLGKLDAVD